jgi:excisionase family DNA binding protein
VSREPQSFTALTFTEVTNLPAVVDLSTAARALGIGRTTAYALARDNDFPCPVLRIGGTYRIPTAELLRVLGLMPTSGDMLGLGLPREASAARVSG